MEARRVLAQWVRNRPWLWDILNPPYKWVRQHLLDAHVRRVFAGRLANTDAVGQTWLSEAMRRGGPLGVGKIGGLEAEVAGFFLRCRPLGETYPAILRKQIYLNAGIFPDTDESLDGFSSALIAAVSQIDILGLMGYFGEEDVIQRYALNARLISRRSLDPWYFVDPWSRHLAGRRVTVVSPFARTIERQYARRREIWPGRELLPSFDLRTIRMPLSPGLQRPNEPDWQTRLARIVDEVEAKPYDVLIVGAGGISILLAAHARRTGRVGFHMGGPTQILFGVRGRRWDHERYFQRAMTAAWVRPERQDTPAGVWQVESACYW